jgi:hypothetical protein
VPQATKPSPKDCGDESDLGVRRLEVVSWVVVASVRPINLRCRSCTVSTQHGRARRSSGQVDQGTDQACACIRCGNLHATYVAMTDSCSTTLRLAFGLLVMHHALDFVLCLVNQLHGCSSHQITTHALWRQTDVAITSANNAPREIMSDPERHGCCGMLCNVAVDNSLGFATTVVLVRA